MSDGVDISVAVATPSGLITPIVTGTAPITLPLHHSSVAALVFKSFRTDAMSI